MRIAKLVPTHWLITHGLETTRKRSPVHRAVGARLARNHGGELRKRAASPAMSPARHSPVLAGPGARVRARVEPAPTSASVIQDREHHARAHGARVDLAVFAV